MLVAILCVMLQTVTASAQTVVSVDPSQLAGTVPEGLYGTGYNGWGDITDTQAIGHLQAIQIRYCRLEVNLKELCGEKPGEYNFDYTTPCDRGQGLTDRVRQIMLNGWTPLLALSTSFSLPRWFKGDPSDATGAPWTSLNLDGSPAAEGQSDQYEALAQITRDLAAALKERGLSALWWETIYEIGHTMPMVDIHYHAARGIKQADPTAFLMGPATWPGWTVEERFVKPYLTRFGPDLLDAVSVHWYADNEHGLWEAPGWKERKGPLNMSQTLFTQYLMETTTKFGPWAKSLRNLLDDPQLNPTGKRIRVAFSEFDAIATSPYQVNPENQNWPDYSVEADCYLNTNYFGGVWCAATLCSLVNSGAADIVLKFNTRQFYGLIDNTPDVETGFIRQPVWFAWRFLQERGGLTAGASFWKTQVAGPEDDSVAHLGGVNSPWVQAVTTGSAVNPRIILINRSNDPQTVMVQIQATSEAMPLERTRYLYDKTRVARFIGRQPGTTIEGRFEGGADDSRSEQALQPLDKVSFAREGDLLTLTLELPAISITVLGH